MSLVEGYFDESGDLETEPGIFCLSGYFIAPEAARLMNAEWRATLEEFEIPYFHMVDCAHGTDIFENMEREDRIELVKQLIALIKKYTLEWFSIFAQAGAYAPTDKGPDAYSECAGACVSALQMFVRMSRVDGKIGYFFEQGHKNKGTAYSHIAHKRH